MSGNVAKQYDRSHEECPRYRILYVCDVLLAWCRARDFCDGMLASPQVSLVEIVARACVLRCPRRHTMGATKVDWDRVLHVTLARTSNDDVSQI